MGDRRALPNLNTLGDLGAVMIENRMPYRSIREADVTIKVETNYAGGAGDSRIIMIDVVIIASAIRPLVGSILLMALILGLTPQALRFRLLRTPVPPDKIFDKS